LPSHVSQLLFLISNKLFNYFNEAEFKLSNQHFGVFFINSKELNEYSLIYLLENLVCLR